MKRKQFKISNNEKNHLKELGFKSIGEGIYIHEFAGYKWRGFTTITCKFTAFNDTHDVIVDVLTENGEYYTPYYFENQNNRVLEIVISNLKEEMNRCGIYEL